MEAKSFDEGTPKHIAGVPDLTKTFVVTIPEKGKWYKTINHYTVRCGGGKITKGRDGAFNYQTDFEIFMDKRNTVEINGFGDWTSDYIHHELTEKEIFEYMEYFV